MSPDRDHAYDRAAMDLVSALAELPEGQRLPRLEEACGGDDGLRARVLTLLGGLSVDGPAACGGTAGEPPVADPHRDPPAPAAAPPRRLGRYRIVGLLGEGGMGVVYEAEQDHPRRRVALKVLPALRASRSLLRRFQFEAAVLGRLEHPGIARVYEAGTADAEGGPQPFLAMELVRGASLTAHADAARLGPRARLDLLARVCDAVQHAHQNGVIHRDLKPANVLVDAAGQPKVLDFGVARLTDADVARTRAAAGTESGQIVGTLAYMSPEQAAGDAGAVDTRADVYALGAIAYELLAGRPAHDPGGRPLLEVLRAVREDEPPRLGALDRGLRGDVETIVAKAMAKERDRRYATAAELAADVRRHLKDEPVGARPAGTWYHAAKFARRNRALVGGVAAAFAALTLGVVGTTVQAVRATRAERAAAAERDRTLAQSREAERQRRAAEDGAAFLSGMIHAAADRAAKAPDGRDREVVRAILDEASRRIEAAPADQAWAHGQVRSTLGNAYFAIGATGEALAHLTRALEFSRDTTGEWDPLTLRTVTDLANVIKSSGEAADLARAGAILRDALPHQRRVLGPDHPVTIATVYALGHVLRETGRLPEAEAAYHDALASYRRVLGDDHDQTRLAWHNLAGTIDAQGRHPEALATLREALRRQPDARGGGDPPNTRLLKVGLADLLAASDPAAAASVFADVFAERYGPPSRQDPVLRQAAGRYADLLERSGRRGEAERLRADLAAPTRPAGQLPP